MSSPLKLIRFVISEKAICYRLNVMSPPDSTMKLNSQYDGIRRWGLWEVMRSEGGNHTSGISALIEET